MPLSASCVAGMPKTGICSGADTVLTSAGPGIGTGRPHALQVAGPVGRAPRHSRTPRHGANEPNRSVKPIPGASYRWRSGPAFPMYRLSRRDRPEFPRPSLGLPRIEQVRARVGRNCFNIAARNPVCSGKTIHRERPSILRERLPDISGTPATIFQERRHDIPGTTTYRKTLHIRILQRVLRPLTLKPIIKPSKQNSMF